jgi:hypothetical protein
MNREILRFAHNKLGDNGVASRILPLLLLQALIAQDNYIKEISNYIPVYIRRQVFMNDSSCHGTELHVKHKRSMTTK